MSKFDKRGSNTLRRIVWKFPRRSNGRAYSVRYDVRVGKRKATRPWAAEGNVCQVYRGNSISQCQREREVMSVAIT